MEKSMKTSEHFKPQRTEWKQKWAQNPFVLKNNNKICVKSQIWQEQINNEKALNYAILVVDTSVTYSQYKVP